MTEYFIQTLKFEPICMEHPNAWVGHLPFAYWLIASVKPSLVVELGTHSGNSYFSFCQSVKENNLSTKCFAIDTWEGDEHAGNYDNDVYIKVNDHNQKNYANFSTLIRKKFDLALNEFANNSIDILHIDGLHTYEAVRHDYETWLGKVADGGFILFHDISVRDRNFGVYKLWEELIIKYPDFISFEHSHGLGVIQVNNKSNNKNTWIKQDFPEKDFFIKFFEVTGSKQIDRFNKLYQLTKITQEKDQIIEEKDQIIEEKDQIILSKNNMLEAIYKSRSWKITKPLRLFMKIIKGIKV
jgi:hypothetical protein